MLILEYLTVLPVDKIELFKVIYICGNLVFSFGAVTKWFDFDLSRFSFMALYQIKILDSFFLLICVSGNDGCSLLLTRKVLSA